MTFKKGQSGNPAGKPKGTLNKVNREIRELADPYVERAFEVLGELLNSKDETTRRLAMKEVFDRRFGRPPQAVYLGGTMAPKNENALPRPDGYEAWLRYQEVLHTAEGTHVITPRKANGNGATADGDD